MPFRRRSAKMNNKISRAAQMACEPLEQRRMLTALVNGVFTGTNTAFEGTSVFEYRQANGNATVRISVVGNITAEFIAGTYDPLFTNPSHVLISDLTPASQATSASFLFSIYVAHADMNSAISIAVVPNDATPRPPRPMQPFTGSIPVNIVNATTGVQTGVATLGGVYIGALSPTTLAAGSQSIPLTVAARRAFGLRPSSAGQLFAGLETAPGVSLGKFFVGGALTGIVDVAGSMDSFYAGNLWTGNAQGISALAVAGSQSPTTQLGALTPTPTNNFHISGDIRNIMVGNSIGTDTLAGLTNLLQPNYKTGFQMSVGGRVGQVLANTSILGSGTVSNDPKVTGPGGAQREIENRTIATAPLNVDARDFSYFDPQFEGFDIAPAFQTPTGDPQSLRLNSNDTFGTAQFLGSARSATLKSASAIQMRGVLETDNADLVDYYAIPLLAGQTVDVQLRNDLGNQQFLSISPQLGVFDPDGRLIASDYSDVNETARFGKTIRIKADRPGSYRIAIAKPGDSNFNGVADPAETNVTIAFNFNYELRVTNIGDIALGGLISTGPIGTLDQYSAGFNVLRGDFGEVRAGTPAAFSLGNPLLSANLTSAGALLGTIFSQSLPWKVSSGNLRSLETVTTGTFVLTGATIIDATTSGPDFLVPKGSIGLLRSTGTGTSTSGNPSLFLINDDVQQFDPVSGVTTRLFPVSTDDLNATPKSLAVGKDIQLVDVAGVLEGDLLANGRIGVIRANQVGGGISPNGDGTVANTIFINSPVWQANVDHSGSDGVIDLIDVTTNLNSAAITTGPGGNVRYMHVGGNAYRDRFFGNTSTPEDRTYTRGERVTVTDDSGTQAILTPTPLDPNTAATLPQNALSAFLDPPVLTVQTYPIRDKGGEVVVRVIVSPQDDTTDGVVRTGGGGLIVDTGARGPNGSFEIGEVARGNPTIINASLPALAPPAGAPANTFTFNAFDRIYVPTALTGTATDPREVNFVFRGKSKVDLWNFNDLITGDTITSIDNQTTGEIVNMTPFGINGVIDAALTRVPDIFTVRAESLGLAASHTGTAVEGLSFAQVTAGGIDNTFPFVNQRNLVRIADVDSITVRRGIGNVLVQNVRAITANSDRKDVSGVFEGIAGPVVSRGTTQLTGNIVSVDIGEGVAATGTGYVSRAGLYADGIIDGVRGSGKNVDIRGNIVAGFQTTQVTQQATDPITGTPLTNPDGTPLIVTTPTSAIGSITLKGGSIVGANIVTNQVISSGAGLAAPSSELFTTGRTYTEFVDTFDRPFYDIGPITISGNGGVLGAYFSGVDMGMLTVNGGFGVISSAIALLGTGVLDGIVADGYGIRNSGFTGAAVHTLNARGTGKNVAVTSYSSSVRFSDKANFDPYSGEQLNAFNDLNKNLGTTKSKPKKSNVTDTGVIEDSSFRGSTSLGKVSAQRIRARNAFVVEPISGKKSRIGFADSTYPMVFAFASSVSSIAVRDNIDGLSLTSADVKQVSAGKDVLNSLFSVSGRLKTLSAGSLRSSSEINVTGPDGQIDSIVTKHDLSSKVTANRGILSMSVGGNVNSSRGIRAGGNVKSLSINGSILTGSTVVVKGTLSKLFIGQDIKAGATLQAGAITEQVIKGQVTGNIVIT